jgi:hypothetical protein
VKVGDLVIFTGNPYFGVIIKERPDGLFCVHWLHDGFESWESDYHLKEFKTGAK